MGDKIQLGRPACWSKAHPGDRGACSEASVSPGHGDGRIPVFSSPYKAWGRKTSLLSVAGLHLCNTHCSVLSQVSGRRGSTEECKMHPQRKENLVGEGNTKHRTGWGGRILLAGACSWLRAMLNALRAISHLILMVTQGGRSCWAHWAGRKRRPREV